MRRDKPFKYCKESGEKAKIKNRELISGFLYIKRVEVNDTTKIYPL